MSSCRRFLGEQARNIYCRTQISSIMCIIYLIICGPGDKYSFFLLSTSNRVDSKRLKHSSRWQLVTVDAERTRTPWCSMQWYASAPKLPGNAYYRERRTFFSAHLLEEIHEGGPRNAIITGQADSKFHPKNSKRPNHTAMSTLYCRCAYVGILCRDVWKGSDTSLRTKRQSMVSLQTMVLITLAAMIRENWLSVTLHLSVHAGGWISTWCD